VARSTGVHDDLYAKALVLDDGNQSVAIVCLDLVGLSHAFNDELVELIRDRTEVETVLINCSHTHSSPFSMPWSFNGWKAHCEEETGWCDELRTAVPGIVEDAAARMTPVSLNAARAPVKISVNRRLMTENGTFIINGTERVVVSQIHRAHGVFFDNYKKTTQSGEELLPQAQVIPARGSWLAFKIDGRKKDGYRMSVQFGRALERIPVTVLLRILGMTSEDMLTEFCDVATYTYGAVGTPDGSTESGWSTLLNVDEFRGRAPRWDLVDAADGKVIVPKDRNLSAGEWEEIAAKGERRRWIGTEELFDIRLARDVVDTATGEIFYEARECVGQV